MLSPQTVLEYVKAEPFRPFRLHMASGRTFEVRHPELIKVLKSHVLLFQVSGESLEIPDECQRVSLMLMETISLLEQTPA
jgi:hypothetical protein